MQIEQLTQKLKSDFDVALKNQNEHTQFNLVVAGLGMGRSSLVHESVKNYASSENLVFRDVKKESSAVLFNEEDLAFLSLSSEDLLSSSFSLAGLSGVSDKTPSFECLKIFERAAHQVFHLDILETTPVSHVPRLKEMLEKREIRGVPLNNASFFITVSPSFSLNDLFDHPEASNITAFVLDAQASPANVARAIEAKRHASQDTVTFEASNSNASKSKA